MVRNNTASHKYLCARKGFTLVEILITIVIIGVLAGSMLLVFGPVRERARASRIVSDMRTLKIAAVMYYHEHKSFPEGQIDPSFAATYLGQPAPASTDGSVWYSFESESSTDCLVVVNLPDNAELKRHLARFARSSGLFQDENATELYGSSESPGSKAYMPVALP